MSAKIEAVAKAIAAENGQPWGSMSGYRKSKFYGFALAAIEAADLYEAKMAIGGKMLEAPHPTLGAPRKEPR